MGITVDQALAFVKEWEDLNETLMDADREFSLLVAEVTPAGEAPGWLAQLNPGVIRAKCEKDSARIKVAFDSLGMKDTIQAPDWAASLDDETEN